MTDPLKDMKILIPMIRKLHPQIVAQDIVGVQPMNLAPPKWERARDNPRLPIPDGYIHINVNREIAQWIESQPLHQWKHGELGRLAGFYDSFIVSEELLAWLILRWS